MTPNSTERGREDRLNEVLLAYVEACEAGREPKRAELLTAHPDLRDDLAAFFASHDEVERLTAPLRARSRENDECPPNDEGKRAAPVFFVIGGTLGGHSSF